MQIVIPSYKRADDCCTADLIDTSVVFVHEFEKNEYVQKYGLDRVVGIPDDLRGKGMAVIRNYILDNTKDEEVLMLDDDIKQFGYYEKNDYVRFKPEELPVFFKNNFRMCRELGTRLWGLNLQSDKKFYREYSPISLSSVILGPCFGVIKDKDIRFDDFLGLKEDYDYSLQVLLKYRKILRLNKYHYMSAHITKKGGCSVYRTTDKEIQQAERFQRKWGSKVVKIKRKTQGGNASINPVVHCPIKGI